MHVLIIEDESMIAMHVEEYMRDLGFQTFSTAAGQDEAVELASRKSPDFILADYRLRQGTGVEAVRRICSHGEIPTVYVAALASEVKRAEPEAIVLEKPFMSDELALAVQLALARH